jgi:hypothetical protein
MASHQQLDEGTLGGLLRIIVSIATILALYTGMTWYVFHIYFGQIMAKMVIFDQHVTSSAEWKMKHSEDSGILKQKVDDIDVRVTTLEAKGHMSRNTIIR